MATLEKIPNYVAGQWRQISATESQQVLNPANQEILAESPLSSAADVDAAVEAAASAFPEWRRTPREDRIQPLFKLKHLLELHLDELARIITGKREAIGRGEGSHFGVAAPMAYFPFSGWKNSFSGDLHGQGRDGVEFYTDKKVVVERWASGHSRRF